MGSILRRSKLVNILDSILANNPSEDIAPVELMVLSLVPGLGYNRTVRT